MPKVSQPDKEAKEKVYIWIAAYQENGDQDAQYNLVVHYKNLVESIARKYSQGKSFHEDLVQVGNIGLLGAIRRYDATFGKSFEALLCQQLLVKSNGFYVIKHGVSMCRAESKS